MVIACALTESGLRNYANANLPQSLNLPHDAVGTDHASVGIFQQQFPSWGPLEELMNPYRACFLFLDGLEIRGLDRWGGPPLAERIQAVQVSAPGQYPVDPATGLGTGRNYAAQLDPAQAFLGAYWNLGARAVK